MSLQDFKRLQDLNKELNDVTQQIDEAKTEYDNLRTQAASELIDQIRDEFREMIVGIDCTVQEQQNKSSTTYLSGTIECAFDLEIPVNPTIQVTYQAQDTTKTVHCAVLNRFLGKRGGGSPITFQQSQTEVERKVERKEEQLLNDTETLRWWNEKIQNFTQDDSYRLKVLSTTPSNLLDRLSNTRRRKEPYNSLRELLDDIVG